MLIIDKRSFFALLLLLPLACSKKLRGEKAVLSALSKPHHEVKSTTSDLTAAADEELKMNDEDGEVTPNDHSSSKKSKNGAPDDSTAGAALPRACSAYSACNGQFPGDCCPTVDGVFLGCCYGAIPDQPAVTPSKPIAAPVPPPQQVVPPAAACSSNPFCVAGGVTKGMCCPTTDMRMLGKIEREVTILNALTARTSSFLTTCVYICTSLFSDSPPDCCYGATAPDNTLPAVPAPAPRPVTAPVPVPAPAPAPVQVPVPAPAPAPVQVPVQAPAPAPVQAPRPVPAPVPAPTPPNTSRATCSSNPQCAKQNLLGDCCPTSDGKVLGKQIGFRMPSGIANCFKEARYSPLPTLLTSSFGLCRLLFWNSRSSFAGGSFPHSAFTNYAIAWHSYSAVLPFFYPVREHSCLCQPRS
jgi:hypothetical protein